MIRLELIDKSTRLVPVELKELDTSDLRKYSQNLCKLGISRHVRIHKNGNDVDIIGMFGTQNRVPDADRYRVTVGDGVCQAKPHSKGHIKPTKNNHKDHCPNQGKSDCTIVLLLESPHKFEYENGDPHCPIAPAQGTAGKNIEKFLGCSLYKSGMATQIGNNARVIIANPVQYQTSLWTIHQKSLSVHWVKRLRDAVWNTLWRQREVQEDFCCRLRAYSPDIVLSAWEKT